MAPKHTTWNNKNSGNGLKEEKIFQHSVEKYMKLMCVKSSTEDDKYKHIDFHMSNGWNVDVKMHKQINNRDAKGSDKFIWVELRNNYGYPGWIDGKATHIAFSITTDYIFVERTQLRDLVKSKIKSYDVKIKDFSPKPYIIYRRLGLEDKIVLVPWEDVLTLEHTKIQRDGDYIPQ